MPPGATSTLVVVNNAPAFHEWAQGLDFGPANLNGLLEDANADGSTNLAAFAFNLLPFTDLALPMTPGTGVAGLPFTSAVGAGVTRRLSIEFVRRKAGTNSGLTYRPQFSTSLLETGIGSWEDATGTPVVTSIDATWERVVIEDTVQGADRRFGRLKVEITAPVP